MAELRTKEMKPFTDFEKKLIEDPDTKKMIEETLARAERKGFEICDEMRSNAYWSVCCAAKRFRPEEGKPFAAFAFPWVYGSIGRTRGLNMRYGSYCEDFLNYIPNREEAEVDEDHERQIEILKQAISRLDSTLKPVAELMLEGDGIRKVSAKLGHGFHKARQYCDMVKEAIAADLGFDHEALEFEKAENAKVKARIKARKKRSEGIDALNAREGVTSKAKVEVDPRYAHLAAMADEMKALKQGCNTQVETEPATKPVELTGLDQVGPSHEGKPDRAPIGTLRHNRMIHLKRFGEKQAHLRRMRVKDRLISLATVA